MVMQFESADGQAASAVDVVKDAISDLIALGYKPQEVIPMVSKVETKGLAMGEVIRLVLRLVAR